MDNTSYITIIKSAPSARSGRVSTGPPEPRATLRRRVLTNDVAQSISVPSPAHVPPTPPPIPLRAHTPPPQKRPWPSVSKQPQSQQADSTDSFEPSSRCSLLRSIQGLVITNWWLSKSRQDIGQKRKITDVHDTVTEWWLATWWAQTTNRMIWRSFGW